MNNILWRDIHILHQQGYEITLKFPTNYETHITNTAITIRKGSTEDALQNTLTILITKKEVHNNGNQSYL